MIKRNVLIFIVVTLMLITSQLQAEVLDSDDPWLAELLDQALDQHEMPGLAAAILDKNGIVLTAVAGVRERGQPAQVTTSDRWHLGSCTKAMTAMLYADLVRQGKAEWGATLPELFPTIDAMDPAWQTVTIEDLFSHRAGVGNLGISWFLAYNRDKRPLSEQRAATTQQLLRKPPRAEYGSFEYSNFGYIIAGHAIEQITGVTWEQSLEEHLPGQLMERDGEFGYGPPQGEQPIGHRRLLFFGTGAVGQRVDKADNPPALGPAGTVHASLAGWAGFVRGFLDPELAALTKHLTTPPTPDADYALGWGMYESDHFGQAIGHSGSNTFWVARVDVFPDAGLAVLLNINEGDKKALEASQTIGNAIIEALAARVKQQ
ncbi:MAG: serine hydrolase domain-containing protein [Pseudomonadota bacterium]